VCAGSKYKECFICLYGSPAGTTKRGAPTGRPSEPSEQLALERMKLHASIEEAPDRANRITGHGNVGLFIPQVIDAEVDIHPLLDIIAYLQLMLPIVLVPNIPVLGDVRIGVRLLRRVAPGPPEPVDTVVDRQWPLRPGQVAGGAVARVRTAGAYRRLVTVDVDDRTVSRNELQPMQIIRIDLEVEHAGVAERCEPIVERNIKTRSPV